MALPYTSQVEATTHNLLESFAEDNIYGSSPLFYHLKETGQIMADGGSAIQVPITYQKLAAGGSFSGADILNTNPTDTETATNAAWKMYYVHVVITEQDLMRNSGDNARVRLIETKTKNAHLKMADMLSTDIFSTNGDSSTGITGLRNALSTSTTHHGIAPADFAAWIADVNSTTSTMSLSALEGEYINATIGSDMPDIAVTTKFAYKKYWALLTANQRYGEEQTASGGFKYLLINGVPVFHDSHCPGVTATATNHWFFLNSKHLFMYVHQDYNFNVEKLPPPSTQAVRIHRMLWAGNLVVTNRRMISGFTILNT